MGSQTKPDMMIRKLMFNISTLEDLGKVLSSSEEFQVSLKTALSSIMGSLPVSKGGFFIYRQGDEKNGSIELVATRGVDLAPGLSLPLPETIKNGFLTVGKAVFRHAAPSFCTEYLEKYFLIFEGMHTYVLQPLVFKKEFMGLVCLGRKFNQEAFNPSDLELLRIMGNYTSIGLHNQNLMNNLEKTNVALRKKVIENSRLYADLQEMYMDTVSALGAAIDAKDPYTRGHSDRVAQFSVAIARKMGLDTDEIKAINLASHLHDIGKIAIDNSILCKPKKLNKQEFQTICRHPIISYDILSNIRFPYRDVAMLTKHHHERLDGSGYPEGRSGADLSIGMRILALADAFDAMTSDRPYRPALNLEEALDEISRGVYMQFDRDVATAFFMTLKEETTEGTQGSIINDVINRTDCGKLNGMLDRAMISFSKTTSH